MRIQILLVTVVLLVASLPAHADSTRFGNRLVSTGDSIGTVLQVAGKPDRTVRLENEHGGAVGERWEYYRSDGSTVLITIRDGRVQAIDEVR